MSICLSHDNNIISGSLDNSIKIWDIKTGNLINELKGHSEVINNICISENDKLIVSDSLNQLIIHNIQTGKIETSIKLKKKNSIY